ncbi:MAG: competence/damage-inducible protein A [Woronichinia naegeliana WA131]|jgi:nicotinamide-nucleotide amidase|uniref:CinA-like protein n=1 Tax=Woronichinia naegeliana WA131 TaxID=2824559 RepID=A0A977PU78_9CYAN|nr:MAG: competence/damage-inducible protein A [Woronichinia naegeliana WA131]
MSAEIICVGTELLLGEILNSNVQFLAQELAQLGIPHYYQTVVGDNLQRIHQVMETALQRASILIFTGGLGPTTDDLTTEAIAAFFKTPLQERPEIIADITEKFSKIGRTMAANNRKQALLPQGADILANPTGTAPGLIWQPQPGITLLTFPGVPSEMKRMWQETAIPYLKSQGWGQTSIYSQVLRFRGVGESTLAEKVAPFFELQNPTVAPYAGLGEVRLRISSRASSEGEALAVIAPIAEQIRAIAGLDYFGKDDETLGSVVGEKLRQKGQTVSVAESCTGGGLGAILTEVAGSSDYFWGGIIAYDNRVKVSFLGVNPQDLAQYGAVSSLVAEQMALGVKTRLGTDWGISITGIAGPCGGSEQKPVGLVYIGLATPDGTVISQEHRFGAIRGREAVRYLGACTALDQLRRQLIQGD